MVDEMVHTQTVIMQVEVSLPHGMDVVRYVPTVETVEWIPMLGVQTDAKVVEMPHIQEVVTFDDISMPCAGAL